MATVCVPVGSELLTSYMKAEKAPEITFDPTSVAATVPTLTLLGVAPARNPIRFAFAEVPMVCDQLKLVVTAVV